MFSELGLRRFGIGSVNAPSSKSELGVSALLGALGFWVYRGLGLRV